MFTYRVYYFLDLVNLSRYHYLTLLPFVHKFWLYDFVSKLVLYSCMRIDHFEVKTHFTKLAHFYSSFNHSVFSKSLVMSQHYLFWGLVWITHSKVMDHLWFEVIQPFANTFQLKLRVILYIMQFLTFLFILCFLI